MTAKIPVNTQESYDTVARKICDHLGLEYVEPLQAYAWQVHLVKSFERPLTLRVGIGQRTENVRQEAWALRRLAGSPANPPVLHLIEETRTGETSITYLLRDYLEGSVLADVGKLPPESVMPLERAVRISHRRGIAGLDINEENVLITPSGARLFDFSETMERNVVGPERFKEARLYDLDDLARLFRYYVPSKPGDSIRCDQP
jgi:hypothetical protein